MYFIPEKHDISEEISGRIDNSTKLFFGSSERSSSKLSWELREPYGNIRQLSVFWMKE